MHRRRNIARITLLAFLLNAILPFFAVYDAPAHTLSAKELGEKVLICTGDGFKWVKWEDLQKGSQKHTPPSHYECALCYVSAHGVKDIITPDPFIPAASEAGGSASIVSEYRPAAFYLQSSLSSRAPPSFLL